MDRRNAAGLDDKDLFLLIAVAVPLVYFASSLVFPNSPVPLLAAVFVATNMSSRTNAFVNLVDKIQPVFSRAVEAVSGVSAVGSAVASTPGLRSFDRLSEASKLELLAAIRSLQAYGTNSKNANERHKKLFKMMSWRQQKLCDDVGYLNRLARIDRSIQSNQSVFTQVANSATAHYGLNFHDFDLLNQNKHAKTASSTNYRVVEALGHFVRDWCADGEDELRFLVLTAIAELNRIIPQSDRSKTCVLIPGSGLGRVAHEIASLRPNPFAKVHAVEYSGLMQICNAFVYAAEKDEQLFPYIHSSSNFVKTSSQFRSTTLKVPASKPDNLELNHDDFTEFVVPDHYENVVVLSVFFLDTAENLLDYMDAIEKLTRPTKTSVLKNGYWINVGPLKYGSAAQAELTGEELAKLRRAMGWKDIHAANSIEEPRISTPDQNGLVGYITDKESLWQGYYGLTMWNSARRENAEQL